MHFACSVGTFDFPVDDMRDMALSLFSVCGEPECVYLASCL